MSDTPETDEVDRGNHRGSGWYAYEKMQKHAQGLERERDQARDRQWADAIHSCHNECARPMCVLRRERDEWREKAERLQSAWSKWSESELLLTHCQNCKEFRGHGHECKSEPPQPPARNCRECCGQGQVEIQSGPYMRECTECNGTGKQTNQNHEEIRPDSTL